jgi:hypothetical protein
MKPFTSTSFNASSENNFHIISANNENVARVKEFRESSELDSHSSSSYGSGSDSTGNDSEETSTPDKPRLDERKKERPPLGFYVNRTGFPIKDFVWERMWQHVQNVHPNGFATSFKIRGNKSLPNVPVPNLPNFTHGMDVALKLELVQKYISELKYNHTGTQFFEIRKDRPLSGLMESAKEMIRESLPIKCLEATILALHLTNGIPGLQRFTIGFKTQINTAWLSHVVLGIYYNGKFGALGLSRRDDLMYKPLKFRTLYDLIENYKTCYNKYFHVLKKVKIGYPIAHDPHSYERINWKYLTLSMDKLTTEQKVKLMERFSRELKTTSLGFSSSPQVTCKKELL